MVLLSVLICFSVAIFLSKACVFVGFKLLDKIKASYR